MCGFCSGDQLLPGSLDRAYMGVSCKEGSFSPHDCGSFNARRSRAGGHDSGSEMEFSKITGSNIDPRQ